MNVFSLYVNTLRDLIEAMIDLIKTPGLSCREPRSVCPVRESKKWIRRGKEGPVKKPTLKKPSKVERARVRLDAAVTRLEKALGQQGGATPSASGGEVQIQELETLRGENTRLREINEKVSARLDGAIGRLNAVIGEA